MTMQQLANPGPLSGRHTSGPLSGRQTPTHCAIKPVNMYLYKYSKLKAYNFPPDIEVVTSSLVDINGISSSKINCWESLDCSPKRQSTTSSANVIGRAGLHNTCQTGQPLQFLHHIHFVESLIHSNRPRANHLCWLISLTVHLLSTAMYTCNVASVNKPTKNFCVEFTFHNFVQGIVSINFTPKII